MGIELGVERVMPIEVETKDCTALADAELAEMADLCAAATAGFDVGYLSKQRDEWVLVTQAREKSKLRGFSFCTLERIGGTPALLVGVAAVDRIAKADQILRQIMGDQYRRAVLAFPDEDVLVGTRLFTPMGFAVLAGLHDVIPRPGHKASGEERAWGRRLAKRFGVENHLDDKTFVISGDGSVTGGVDFISTKVKLDEGIAELFRSVVNERHDSVVAFGWAMAEDLAHNKLGR